MKLVPTLPPVVSLCVVTPAKAQISFRLRPEHSVFIGTSSNCGLRLSGEGVSGIHCYVRFEEGKLWVEDWMSQSGTLINGLPIAARVEAQLGDIIQVGDNEIAIQDATQTASSSERTSHQAPTVETDDHKVAADLTFASCSDAQPAIAVDTSDTSEWAEPAASDEPMSWNRSRATFECFGSDLFETDEDEPYDRETIALLRAEIEHLQAALAQREGDGEHELDDDYELTTVRTAAVDGPADSVLARMQEVIEEANRSDERVTVLEELLLATEIANDHEREERRQLEAWADDIEQRLAQREAEHQAEVELMRNELTRAAQTQERLVQQLRLAAGDQTATQAYHQHIEQLQQDYQKLQQEFAESQRQCVKLQQQLAQATEGPQRELREERLRLAEEQQQVANLKLQLSSQLITMKDSVMPKIRADSGADHRIQALRDHLLQIHQLEQQAAKAASLPARFRRLWQRADR